MNVVIGRDTAWSVTGASKKAASPFNFLTLQVVTFVILLATTAVGVWRDMLNSQVAIATVWAGLNTVILGAFLVVAMAEARTLRRDDTGAHAIDAKSVALSEFLAAPEPRSTPYTLILAELRARQAEADRKDSSSEPAIKETSS
jgi:cellulose synthase (UDP-forming)